MRISKVKTSAFAISEGIEKTLIQKIQNNPQIRLHKRYLPLGRLKLIKSTGANKGAVFKKNRANIVRDKIYVDLSYLNIFYVTLGGVLNPKPKIQKTDILQNVINFTPHTLRTLNYIWERNSVQYDGLDKDIVLDLARQGFVVISESGDSQLFNLMRIITDETMITKYCVKTIFYLPKFGDKRYDLASILSVTDTIDESYNRDTVRHSIKKIEEVVGYLFNCEATLEEITYLPQLTQEYRSSANAEVVTCYPLCSKGNPNIKQGYATETKLTPISLSTELYADDSIPLEKSTITFSDLGGLKEAKGRILEAIIYPLVRPDLSKKFGKTSGGGILLYGPPGCGKSQLARAAVTECGVSFFNVNVSDIMNKKGDEAKKLHEVFERAGSSAPAIIFFDEIDALCSRKGSSDESREKVLNQFLMDMSGVERVNEGVLVIAATNIPWGLDPALRRAGRFTKQIFIPPPDLDARKEILAICTKDRPLSPDVDFKDLAELTEGYSGADIAEICNIAATIPWKNALCGESERGITLADFLIAIKGHKSSLIAWSLAAEELITQSKEEEIYDTLFETVKKLNKRFTHKKETKSLKQPQSNETEIEQLRKERQEIEDKIELLETKHREGKIEGKIYSDMMKDYHEKLIEFELKMRKTECIR